MSRWNDSGGDKVESKGLQRVRRLCRQGSGLGGPERECARARARKRKRFAVDTGNRPIARVRHRQHDLWVMIRLQLGLKDRYASGEELARTWSSLPAGRKRLAYRRAACSAGDGVLVERRAIQALQSIS